MRRVDRSKTTSRATSTDGNLTDDGEGSTKSQGSGSKKKQHMTMEERAAAYKEARSRIFMDFEEKDASASSNGAISSAASTVSYTGGSTGMSSIDGDGASTAPTESEYSGPAGRGKEARYGGPFEGGNGRVNQMNGAPPLNTTLRSSAPPFTSPNVAPPPPKGTVHYIQPMMESATGQEMNSQVSHPMPGAPPGPYTAYPAPPIFPYYMPYGYSFPYAQTVPLQPPNNGVMPSQEAQAQEVQNTQQPHPIPMPSGFGAPVAHSIPQPYPGYVWIAAPAPGYLPVPPHPTIPAHPPNMPAQTQPSSSNPNITRPASQASHISFDPRLHHTAQGVPQQHASQQQVSSFAPYIPHSNTFPPSHSQSNHNPMSSNRPSMPMHSTPPAMYVNVQNQHPNRPPSGASFPSQHGPIGPINQATPQTNGNGPWGNQSHMSNLSNATSMSPRSQQRGGMPPPSLPGRSPGPPDGNWAPNGGGPSSGMAGTKRNGPRTSWGSHSYGPGVNIGGMHTANPLGVNGVGATPLRAPEGINIRVLPAITLDGHSTGSSNGSSSSARKRNLAHGAGSIKPPGDETSSVTVRLLRPMSTRR